MEEMEEVEEVEEVEEIEETDKMEVTDVQLSNDWMVAIGEKLFVYKCYHYTFMCL